jgi:hypothetical protein
VAFRWQEFSAAPLVDPGEHHVTFAAPWPHDVSPISTSSSAAGQRVATPQRRSRGLTEIRDLSHPLNQCAAEVLAFLGRPGTATPRLEHLRGSAIGFRNLTNDIAPIAAGSRNGRVQAPPTLSNTMSP